MPLEEPSEIVRTRDGVAWRRAERTWPFGTWGRASRVQTHRRKAVLLELEGDWSDVMAADHDAAGEHVLTSFERGRFVASTSASASSPYRSPSSEPVETRYALLPWIVGGTLASALSRARAGERVSPERVATLGVEIALGLGATAELGPLTPGCVVIDAKGPVCVRGPLLSRVVTRIGASTLAALPYTAPEVLGGKHTQRSETMRTFALGVMLHDLLSGAPLFPEGAEGARAIAGWKAPSVAHMPPAPAALRETLWLMLQGDPNRRPSPRAIVDRLAPLHTASSALADALLGDARTPMPYFGD